MGGLARLADINVVVIGNQKGRTLKERSRRNFGMAKPEGYRKALRLMKLAEKFDLPVVTFVDTPGAYPGIDAEQRGQSEAIGRNLFEMAGLKVPVLTCIIGEGGSAGTGCRGHGDDAAVRHLFGDFSGRLCFHSLEGCCTGAARG